jgi:hypothetical protein
VAALGFLGTLNSLPLIYRSYDTSMPMAIWKLVVGVSVIVVPLLEGMLAWLLIGAACSIYPDAWKVFSRTARRVWRRDAVVALVVSLAATLGLARLEALLTSVFHAHAPIKDSLFPAAFSTQWPAAEIFIASLTHILFYAAVAGFLIFIVRAGWRVRAWWLWLGLALVLVSLGPSHAHTLAGFGVGWLLAFLPLLVAAGVVALFLRDNILAYLMVLFCTQVAEPLIDSLSQANPFFRQNGVALALLAAGVVAWMLWTSGGEEQAAE